MIFEIKNLIRYYGRVDSFITVVKASGEKEPFSEDKVLESIRRAGIPQKLQGQVLAHVKNRLYNNIPSREIYHHITEFLKAAHPHFITKYSLKQSLIALGPTGYPFEDFIAELLHANGYTTITRTIVQGQCVTHEIDVLAQRNGRTAAIECKFHNAAGTRSDVHVAMYTKARFDDIKKSHNIESMWLVTNTKVTSDAVKYAMCSGVKILSWNYPAGHGLREIIEHANLHPITELTSLSQQQKQKLLENHIVLAKTLRENKDQLAILGLSRNEKDKILAEVNYLLGFGPIQLTSFSMQANLP